MLDQAEGNEPDDWRDGYNKGYEHGWDQSASKREAELEAENKRLGAEVNAIDTWVSAAIDDLRSRVDALESEVRDAHVNASGMSGYFTLGGRLNSMQKRICALESPAPVPVEDGEKK